MADNPSQNPAKPCGDVEAKATAELLDHGQDLEAAYKIFAECFNIDDVGFQKYALKTNSLEKNGVGNDLSIVINDRFPRTPQSGTAYRNLYADSYHFE